MCCEKCERYDASCSRGMGDGEGKDGGITGEENAEVTPDVPPEAALSGRDVVVFFLLRIRGLFLLYPFLLQSATSCDSW